jgi:hypothetical protein
LPGLPPSAVPQPLSGSSPKRRRPADLGVDSGRVCPSRSLFITIPGMITQSSQFAHVAHVISRGGAPGTLGGHLGRPGSCPSVTV